MKTCLILGNVIEYTDGANLFMKIGELMGKKKVSAADGIMAYNFFTAGKRSVVIDGTVFFELSEL